MVIGASGATGRVVVRELVTKGKRVRAVNRGGCADVPDGVEVLAGDATDPNRMREVCQSAVVVYHYASRLFVGGSSYSTHLAGLRGSYPISSARVRPRDVRGVRTALEWLRPLHDKRSLPGGKVSWALGRALFLAGVAAAGEAAEEAQGERDERRQGEEGCESAFFSEGSGDDCG